MTEWWWRLWWWCSDGEPILDGKVMVVAVHGSNISYGATGGVGDDR